MSATTRSASSSTSDSAARDDEQRHVEDLDGILCIKAVVGQVHEALGQLMQGCAALNVTSHDGRAHHVEAIGVQRRV